MKIVCATNMPFVEEAFKNIGTPIVIEGREISHKHVKDAEILAIRSTTKVDANLLENTAVKFVGTATIGTDHMDIPYLERKGIKWCYAPGCNANSVSEYFTAAILCLANRYNIKLEGKTLGIIGVGNVGKLVALKGKALGMNVLENDPPRERIGDILPGERFVSINEILKQSDIITFHVPLIKQGIDKTFHMADENFFKQLKPGCILINAARGAVVSTPALLQAIKKGIVSHCIIDTWENEPDYNIELMDRADIVSPHIAGHSYEGKVMGTVMVFEQICRFLGIKSNWSVDPLLPAPVVPEVKVTINPSKTDEEQLWAIVRRVYDIEQDDKTFRATAKLPDNERLKSFDTLRTHYPIRREFRFTRLVLDNVKTSSLIEKARQLGFQIVS